MTGRKTNQVIQDRERAIGWRIEQRRRQLGMRRGELATRLDLTVAQLGKLLSGQSAISAGRMDDIAAILTTTVTELYDDQNYVRQGHRLPRGENELMGLYRTMTEINQRTFVAVARVFAQRETR